VVVIPAKLLKLTRIYIDRYLDIPKNADSSPLNLAEEYDRWFTTEYRRLLEAQLTITGGKWQAGETDPAAIRNGGRLAVEGASRIIVNPAVDWVVANYPVFWKQGAEGLYPINLEIQGKPSPKKVKLTQNDITQIKIYAARQASTLQDHAARHRRQVERAIGNGLQFGWTTDRFMEAMTAPDGHIVGFPYGNSRYSWYEHMRRMIVGRSKTLAMAAVEFRMAGKA